MTTIPRLLLAVILVFSIVSPAFADSYSDTREMFIRAGLSEMFDKSYGYAIFPTIGKAGMVVGGAYGEGRVYENNKYIGEVSMIQGSIGFQLGGKGFSEVVFFQDKRALDEFVSGEFEFGAEAQATAITAAAGASANTAGNSTTVSGTKNNAAVAGTGYKGGMATYTITKGGLMYEASISGQKFSFKKRQ